MREKEDTMLGYGASWVLFNFQRILLSILFLQEKYLKERSQDQIPEIFFS